MFSQTSPEQGQVQRPETLCRCGPLEGLGGGTAGPWGCPEGAMPPTKMCTSTLRLSLTLEQQTSVRDNFAPRGHLAMPGDIPGCYTQEAGGT